MALIPQIDNQFELKQSEKLIPSKTYKLMESINTTQKKLKEPISIEGTYLNIDDVGELKGNISILGNSKQATRSGKNLLPSLNITRTINGITFTHNEDGSITVNGTNGENRTVYQINVNGTSNTRSVPLKASTKYTLSGCSTGSTSTYLMQAYLIIDDTTRYFTNSNNPITFETVEETTAGVYIVIYENATVNNVTFYPQLEIGEVATTYEPYGASPSPEFPSEIENVEGKNLIPFTNQNFTLKGINYYIQNRTLYFNGTSSGETSSIDTNFKDNFSFKLKAGTYTFSHKIGVVAARIIKASDNTQLVILNRDASSITFTLEEETECYLGFYQYQFSYENVNTEIMIEKGTVATEYVPYNSLAAKVTGKNLLKNTALSSISNGLNFTINADGSIRINGTSTARTLFNINFTKPITLLENTRYTLSKFGDDQIVEVYLRKLSISELIASMAGTGTYKKFTNTYTEEIFCYIAIPANVTIDTTISLQLEQGEEATDYEPYKSQTVYFPLSEGQKLYEESYLANDGVHNNKKQITLDGVTSGLKVSAYYLYSNGLYYAVVEITDFAKMSIDKLKCTHFVCSNAGVVKGNSYITNSGKSFVFVLNDQTFTTAAQVNNWLAEQYATGTPVIIEYELAKAKTIPYILEQKEAWDKLNNFSLYSPKSIITASNDLAILKLTYYPVSSIDFETEYIDRIIGYTDNLEAIQQAAYHILNTERNAYLIYDKDYGVELEQYKGKDIDYIKATINKVLKDALTHDLRIIDVSVNDVAQITNDMVWIDFTINSIYGDLIMEVNVNV